jgi:hypothetical protein
VLETDIETRDGAGLLVEAMAIEVTGHLLPQTVLVRKLACDRGALATRVRFDPKRGLPGRPPRAGQRAGTLVCEWGFLAVGLQSFPHIQLEPGEEISVRVPAGVRPHLVMTIADRSPAIFLSPKASDEILAETQRWCEQWSADIRYDGPWASLVSPLASCRKSSCSSYTSFCIHSRMS